MPQPLYLLPPLNQPRIPLLALEASASTFLSNSSTFFRVASRVSLAKASASATPFSSSVRDLLICVGGFRRDARRPVVNMHYFAYIYICVCGVWRHGEMGRDDGGGVVPEEDLLGWGGNETGKCVYI